MRRSFAEKMLTAMPLFHGFGLGVCIHTMLSQGGRCILVPRFTAQSYAKLITKYHCNFIAGVPTLYEALLRLPSMDGANLSSLKGVFSGGDSLSIERKKKLDKFLYAHGAPVPVREGYGTTETVTACCLTPPHMFKEEASVFLSRTPISRLSSRVPIKRFPTAQRARFCSPVPP